MSNRKFQIITDSGCDLPEEYFTEHNVECVKLGFVMDGVDYQGEEGQDITPKEFYQKLKDGALPTTYQITPEVAREHIEPYLKNGTDVLVVAFSSGLSGTADSFIVASKELQKEYPERNIFVIDSLCASLGQGLLLHYVVEKADTGESIENTAAYVENLKLKIDHQFTVNDLFHLKRGGRVSSTTAVVGTMLNIKPTLHVDNAGKLTTTGKAIGRKRALRKLIENMCETSDITSNDPIYICHADCIEDAEYLKTAILERFPNNEVFINFIGPVIGCHAGIGTIAIFFKTKNGR